MRCAPVDLLRFLVPWSPNRPAVRHHGDEVPDREAGPKLPFRGGVPRLHLPCGRRADPKGEGTGAASPHRAEEAARVRIK